MVKKSKHKRNKRKKIKADEEAKESNVNNYLHK